MRAARKPPTHLYIAGAAVFVGASASAYFYSRAHVALPQLSPGATSRTFSQLADVYDAAIGSEETWMGVGILRWWYIRQHAKGSVLEISAGTGRNLPHYFYPDVTSLTLTDISRPMVQQAENKYFDELRLGYKYPDTRVTFTVADAHCLVQAQHGQGLEPASAAPGINDGLKRAWRRLRGMAWPSTGGAEGTGSAPAAADSTAAANAAAHGKRLPALQGDGGSILNVFRVLVPGGLDKSAATQEPHTACIRAHTFDNMEWQEGCSAGRSPEGVPLARFPPASFDCVVDTYGLCSHADPIQVLRQAGEVCKPGGKILLIEHGRSSTWRWLNQHLDDGADRHKATWGCYWNRDILKLVKQAGLRVEYVSRWHFGTTIVIVARPPPTPSNPGGSA